MLSRLPFAKSSAWSVPLLLIALVIFTASGYGFLEPLQPLSVGEQCSTSSQCNAPLTCIKQLCRFACRGDRDCSTGERCVFSNGLPACLPSALVPVSILGPVENDTDRNGDDLLAHWLPVDDPYRCQSDCTVHPRCRAWTYVKRGIQGSLARCYLKDGPGTVRADRCCVSGTKVLQAGLQEPLPPPPRPSERGALCEFNTSCDAPMVCRHGLCRFECLTDRDCARNQRCAGPPYQICIPFASFPASLFPPLETNVDRPGNDLWSFIMWVHDPQVCRSECSGNSQCRAFTYVKPGFQGPFARCYLKRATRTARPNTCCISGVPAGR